MYRRGFLAATLAAQGGAQSSKPRSQRRSSGSLRQRMLAALEKIEAVNTHEHIIPESERTSQQMDFFVLAGHYAVNDVISAGLSREAVNRIKQRDTPLAEKWRLFEPFWKPARFTGYGQALRIAIRDIYGFDEISGATLPRINEAIAARNRPGLYRDILKERAHIGFSVLDDYWNAKPVAPDPEFFVLARKFDRFVTPAKADDVQQLEKITDVSISTLAGLRQALERSFEQSLAAGMVTVKSTIAYNRELLFQETTEQEAAGDLEMLLRGGRELPQGFRRYSERPYRKLEDYMFHQVIRLAVAHHVPVQIHTGLHAGNGNFIANSNPTHLTNLFFLYSTVPFDLFHISYPYQGELAVLAKLFPNVHVDFCWAHIISPSVSRRTLHEMLETVPVNKLFGFGGDYRYPELSYAHARMALNIAQVLAEKIEQGFCAEEEGVEIGRMLLNDNPARLFPRKERA
ncbi:MAG: amidohydrolase family protein [Bryobacteraceae bacterium]